MQNPTDLLQPSLRQDDRSIAFAKLLNRFSAIPLQRLYLYNLATVIPQALPYLAEQFDVTGLEGWDLVDTEEERRDLIRNAIPLHKLKGTLRGYQTICRLARSRLTYWVSPPATTYLGAALTTAERNAFLEQMPQMRTFRYRRRGKRVGAMLWQQCLYPGSTPSKVRKVYPRLSDAIERIQGRAFVRYPDGREQQLITYERLQDSRLKSGQTRLSVRAPGKADGAFCLDQQAAGWHRWIGRLPGRRFLLNARAGDRMYGVTLDSPYRETADSLREKVAYPGLDFVTIQYKEIREQGTRRGLFLDDFYPCMV